MLRQVVKQVQGSRTNGASGISFVRVLDRTTAEDFDPFLVLDGFDSYDPEEYLPGFPMHPHRGIETVTFLSKGAITHEDNLGNKGTIHDGETQWLTAGSGAFHSEMPIASDRMLGAQLWLNIPAKYKLTAEPFYHGVIRSEVKEFPLDKGKLRLITGNYKGESGIQGKYLPLDYYDILLEPEGSVELDVPGDNRSAMVYTLVGNATVSGTKVLEKTAAKLGIGDKVLIESGDESIEILFMCSERLGEPIAWRGLIVMNTEEQLEQAFRDLEEGTFVKQTARYENV